MEKISLGDVVTIEHQPLGINIKARCIGFTYDCLKQQYEEVVIGHYQKNFFREAVKTTNKVNNGDLNIAEKLESTYTQAITKMSNMMTTAMNGNVVLSNTEILIMDTDDKSTATNVWRFNSAGIAYSNNGYDGDYSVGMTMDGHINGSLITTGTIKGEMLEVNTVTMNELAISIQDTLNSSITESDAQAIVIANLEKFESNLSQTFVTQEEATQQIQDATEVAVQQATSNIVNEAVSKAMGSVNDQLDDKLNDYTTNTLSPTLQNAIDKTLQDSKDYVVEVTGNYYTKDETNSIISQTKEEIEFGISNIYETKEESSIKIEEAIDGVNIGAINRVFGTSEEKIKEFTGTGNDVFVCYNIASDVSDKDVIISFEYDLNATIENGSLLKFQAQYLSTSNEITYSPVYTFIEGNGHEELNLKNQLVSFTASFNALQQDGKFRFRADGITGTFTIRKAQIKVGNKITEWSIAPEDIEGNANNYTVEQLKNYYTKEQTDSRIEIAKDEIELKVAETYETILNVETKIDSAVEDEMKKTLIDYYTKEEVESKIEISKDSIESVVGEKYATKLELENITVGGENLIINSDFKYGFINWEGSIDKYYLTENNTLAYNQTGLTEQKNYQIYTLPIEISHLRDKEITLSFDYNVANKINQTNKNIAYIRFFDSSHQDSYKESDSIKIINFQYPDDYVNGTRRTMVKTIIVPSDATYVRIGAYQHSNGYMYWTKFQLEEGNTHSAWKPCYQDSILYIDSTSDIIFNEVGDLSQIVSINNGSDSLTPSTKVKLISEYNDAIAVYNRLNSIYSELGDTSFNSLPSDLTVAKNELTSVVSALEESIAETSETGLSNVLEKFNNFYLIAEELSKAISNAVAGMTKETKTKVEQLADSYNIVVSDIETIGKDVNELTTHFKFAKDGLTIKSTENATKYIKLDNDSLDFIDNDNMVAQVSDQQLFITDAEVTNQMRIGNILIKPSGIGGIMFIYEE